jgi:hypothetical protein
MRTIFLAALLATTGLGAGTADAASFIVDSKANSSSGGVGLATIAVTSGQILAISADPADLWTLGALPRWTNAAGLTAATFATGSDESGEAFGTQIGANFGLWNQAGLAAPYGSLVGEIGGVFKLLGLSFNGPAWGTGTLKLYNWDSNSFDNAGTITADVSIVPEPGVWALLVMGFGLIGAAVRRERRARVAQ